jgi:hypothetical protein
LTHCRTNNKIHFLVNHIVPKRPATAIERPVAKQHKCRACGLLGHNRQKCLAVPAAAATPVAAAAVEGLSFKNNVEEAGSPLLWSQWPMVMLPTLIVEVLKQLEEGGRGTKSSSWLRSFWIVQGLNLTSQQNPYHPSLWS